MANSVDIAHNLNVYVIGFISIPNSMKLKIQILEYSSLKVQMKTELNSLNIIKEGTLFSLLLESGAPKRGNSAIQVAPLADVSSTTVFFLRKIFRNLSINQLKEMKKKHKISKESPDVAVL